MRPLTVLALFPAYAALAQAPVSIALEPFATGLNGIVDIANAGDDRLFAVLQVGVIRVVNADGTVLPTPFLDIQDHVNSGGEQGLLGLAFDPNYAENGFFYVNYIFGPNAGNTRISRFHVSADPNLADTAEQVIYTWPQPASNHNGGDLDFGPDGLLYFPLGDGGSSSNAQDLSDPLGDIVRIDVSDPDTTYTVPGTNPWVGVTGDTLPEIWASGLRNPFRFGFDALTGDVWIGDVGASTYEEIDFWPAGDDSGPNFGWSCYEGNSAYNTVGCQPEAAYVAPITVHPHGEQSWCSIMGGRVYRGSVFERLYGRYLYTDYCGGQFYTLHPDTMGAWVREEVLSTGQSGYTCIAENNALELFAGNSGTGTIYHILDPCPVEGPVITQEGDVLTSTEWYLNGLPIIGASDQTLVVQTSGTYYVVADLGGGCELASDTIVFIWTSVGSLDLSGVSVYPVPATDHLVVNGLSSDVSTIALLDMAGRAILAERTTSNTHTMLDVNGIAMGSYALLWRDAEGRVMGQRQVSVQH